MVSMPLIHEQYVHFEWSGPQRLRKVAQNTTLYRRVTMVSRTKISPNRVNNCISVARSGSVARMVVSAELTMDTPVNDIAAAALFTRTLSTRHVYKGD